MNTGGDAMGEALGELRARAVAEPFGPVRPEHATGGWELDGDEREWSLVKPVGELRLRVKADTRTTCSWRIGGPDGVLMRHGPAAGVEEAKAEAERWVSQLPRSDVVAGDEPSEEPSPQVAYYADLHHSDQHAPDRAAALRAEGPPPPVEADGYWGRFAYYQHRAEALGDPAAVEMFEQLKAERPPCGGDRS
ncbi:hypothetical protein NDR87_26295 [Nocardia sp. CDC159]|uniref:Uncharacterized protein n=1 Tax=Nocardia pulmonis TaxID=2951408 RepID=A0A9X2EB93_9NOCA|nr:MULTISPECIES: hypothetical protein [Nocardia]MCM6774958.1 hypothetical protein [Nocardia pulmonis]MCM6789889.1 hypothetical protein [Nocardia sp. CDC159]